MIDYIFKNDIKIIFYYYKHRYEKMIKWYNKFYIVLYIKIKYYSAENTSWSDYPPHLIHQAICMSTEPDFIKRLLISILLLIIFPSHHSHL